MNTTPTATQATCVIRKCDRAIASGDPRIMTAAIAYGAAWLREFNYTPTFADEIFARLGEILGRWYGDVSDDAEATPNVATLEELCRIVRSKHDGIVQIETATN